MNYDDNIEEVGAVCSKCGNNVTAAIFWNSILAKKAIKDFIDTIPNYVLRINEIASAIDVTRQTARGWASGKTLLNDKVMPAKKVCGIYIITVKDAMSFFDGTKYERSFRSNLVKLLEGRYIRKNYK